MRGTLHLLFQLGESIALLDTLHSFATFVHASGGQFSRPVMAEGAALVRRIPRERAAARAPRPPPIPH